MEREEKERLAQQVGIINFILHFYRFKPRFVSIAICANQLFRTFFSKRVFLVSCLAAIIRLGVVYTVQLLLTTVACNCRLVPTRHCSRCMYENITKFLLYSIILKINRFGWGSLLVGCPPLNPDLSPSPLFST